MVYIWPKKSLFLLYLHLKKLAPGGIWTHTVRAGEGPTTLRVSAHSKNVYGLYFAGKRCIFLYLRLKKLAPGGIWTHHEVTTICHTNTIYHTKRHMVYIWPEKVYFLIPTPEKIGTWWDLNPHCSGWRRCNHITRISPLAKYTKFGGNTAICRGSMTGKVLTRQLNGKKTGIGWDLNTPSWNTAKASLHYA